ncbi:Phytanoyl-CoA dioxygenase (PhyH) [Seminavis robusta]|uniref:Phytanoyl-CoA dioxygenase (PhyH) n=1 Tax=Seminavis robusta TaxID=568900 RepID=A0A9N8E3Z4_9STRA|nr:Phytanoyl-CoA dioxygenase (PhyH) [Seminavis robusta]|eukprot:Sro595_g172670.1 Phytanoyl-CoA dioxygenase (PhyH) (356) ;mRNA; r:44191-45258
MQDNQSPFPAYKEIPVDEEDYRYSQSFYPNVATDLPLAKAFFDQYGFCIFRGVLPKEQCGENVKDMMALLQERNPNVDPENPIFLTGLTHFGCPKRVNSLFRPPLLRLRQDPVLHRVLATVLGNNDLIVNHDRWLLHRPPPASSQKPLTRRNVHIDMNPFEFADETAKVEIQHRLSQLEYGKNDRAFIAENNDVHESMLMDGGGVVQAIVNLRDIPSRDHGGTILIPGSHKTFSAWLGQCADANKRRVGPMQYVLDDNADRELLSLVQHPTLRAGSVIVWDQRVFHGSTPNMSSNFRAAIPIKAFSAVQLQQDPKRARERAAAIQREIERVGFETELTDHGRRVFGLDLRQPKKP